MNLRVQRVRVNSVGMRTVEANLHYRVELWAQCHNTDVVSYDDVYDNKWIVVEFKDPKMSSLFALSFDTTLSIEPCT